MLTECPENYSAVNTGSSLKKLERLVDRKISEDPNVALSSSVRRLISLIVHISKPVSTSHNSYGELEFISIKWSVALNKLELMQLPVTFYKSEISAKISYWSFLM